MFFTLFRCAETTACLKSEYLFLSIIFRAASRLIPNNSLAVDYAVRHEAILELGFVVDIIIDTVIPKAHVHEATVTCAIKVDFLLFEALAETVRVLSGDPVLEILFLILCEGACGQNGDASVELAVSSFKIPFGRT